MKLFKTLGAAAATLLLGTSAHATLLTLPSANEMSTGRYGDFMVYSLDLLEQCSVSDKRCQTFSADGGTRVKSGEGQIAPEIVILTGSSGGQVTNYDNTGPFNKPGDTIGTVKVDNPFLTPTGNGKVADAFDMLPTTADDSKKDKVEPGLLAGDFNEDFNGRWDALISSITRVTGTGRLYFIFDNNQQGSSMAEAQYFWGQVKIWDTGGNMLKCYELNSSQLAWDATDSTGTGCRTTLPTEPDTIPGTGGVIDPLHSGSFQSSGGVFCVDKDSGMSYAATGNGCDTNAAHPLGGYYITNNLGSSTGEFVAYVPDIDKNLAEWSTKGYFMSVEYKMRGLNDGNESLWLTGGTVPPGLPEPGSLALISLALLGMGSVARRRHQAQA